MQELVQAFGGARTRLHMHVKLLEACKIAPYIGVPTRAPNDGNANAMPSLVPTSLGSVVMRMIVT
jgi:hypothetical protein